MLHSHKCCLLLFVTLLLECGLAPVVNSQLPVLDAVASTKAGNVEITEGYATYLLCRFTSSLATPSIAWNQTSGDQTGMQSTTVFETIGTGQIQVTSVLLFKNLTAEQAGRYSCEASGVTGSVAKTSWELSVIDSSTGGQAATPSSSSPPATLKASSELNVVLVAPLASVAGLLLLAVTVLLCRGCCYRHSRAGRRRWRKLDDPQGIDSRGQVALPGLHGNTETELNPLEALHRQVFTTSQSNVKKPIAGKSADHGEESHDTEGYLLPDDGKPVLRPSPADPAPSPSNGGSHDYEIPDAETPPAASDASGYVPVARGGATPTESNYMSLGPVTSAQPAEREPVPATDSGTASSFKLASEPAPSTSLCGTTKPAQEGPAAAAPGPNEDEDSETDDNPYDNFGLNQPQPTATKKIPGTSKLGDIKKSLGIKASTQFNTGMEPELRQDSRLSSFKKKNEWGTAGQPTSAFGGQEPAVSGRTKALSQVFQSLN